MNSRKSVVPLEDIPPPPFSSPPFPAGPGYGPGHPEYHFMSGLMDVQKHLGEISASLQALTKTVESTKSKVDDLTAWKNKILGGAIAVGAICAFIGFGISKLSTYIEFKNPDVQKSAVPPTASAEPPRGAPAAATSTARTKPRPQQAASPASSAPPQ